MRCLSIREVVHLDGTTSRVMVVPCGTGRTKRRTLKKWIRRALRWASRQADAGPISISLCRRGIPRA